MKKLFLIAACAVLFTNTSCLAADDWGSRVAATTTDVLIARPFTFVATIVGAAFWAVTLPITAPTHTAKDALDVMVIKPWEFTFDRPLGEYEG